MARLYRVQGDLAYDSVTESPNLVININDIKTDLTPYLSLKIANREDLIVVDGVFNFRITAGILGIDPTDYINVTIDVYRSVNRVCRAAIQNYQLAGLTLSTDNYIRVNIPILFIENVTIPVSEEYARYYFTITVNGSESNLATVVLEQYNCTAMEIASEIKRITCNSW